MFGIPMVPRVVSGGCGEVTATRTIRYSRNFLKVGHHGSKVSLDAEDAEALDPEVSVASAGENNRYGHPSPECEGILKEAGSVFFCTKDVGDVTVRPGVGGPSVIQQRRAT